MSRDLVLVLLEGGFVCCCSQVMRDAVLDLGCLLSDGRSMFLAWIDYLSCEWYVLWVCELFLNKKFGDNELFCWSLYVVSSEK